MYCKQSNVLVAMPFLAWLPIFTLATQIRSAQYKVSQDIQASKDGLALYSECAHTNLGRNGTRFEIVNGQCRHDCEMEMVAASRGLKNYKQAPASFGNPFSGSTYHVRIVQNFTRSAIWEYCRLLGDFSYMVAIETEAENQHVASLASSAGCVDLTWLGALADSPGSTNFYWHYWDGCRRRAAFYDWQVGQPDNNGGANEDGIVMRGGGQGFKWGDVNPESGSSWFMSKINCAVCEYPVV